MRRLATLGAGVLLTATLAAPALAQTGTTGYPGTTTPPTVGGPTSGSSTGPTLTEGQSFIAEEPGFASNSSNNLGLNGTGAGVDTVDSDGVSRQTVTFVSDGVALAGLRLAAQGFAQGSSSVVVAIDGRQYTARLGQNNLVATGIGTNGAARTFTVSFTLSAKAGVANQGLVRTGIRIVGFTALGLALVAAGVGLVGLAKRRRTNAF